MKTLLLIAASFALAGCVIVPLEPAPAIYSGPAPAVVAEGHYYPRRHRHHRHRHWR